MLADPPSRDDVPKGLDAVWHAVAGAVDRAMPRTKRFLRQADSVLAWERRLAGISDARLRARAEVLRERFRLGRETKEDAYEAVAVVREAAWRQMGQRPFPVQLAGGLALASRCIVEMATGEGKTLTAALAATLMGWRGRGCHVVTANDYLARRDAEWMAAVYRFCGLRVAHIENGMPPDERRKAYDADITYCTNKEVAADYLRDRLVLGRRQELGAILLAKKPGGGSVMDRVVQRGLHYAIVDEADCLLIDEAVTPLILCGDSPNPDQVQAFGQASGLTDHLVAGRDYRIDRRRREIGLTEYGKQRLAALATALGAFWRGARRREELIVQALTAREFYLPGRQYMVDGGKVVIVDEFTGRLMPDRQWRDGLHQAIQAKESLAIEPPKETLARMSFQRFFRSYKVLCGMTGTAAEAWREFWQVYRLPVVPVPTHRPCIRERLTDRIFRTEEAKFRAVVERVRAVHQTGRPILVGTRSVAASEHLSRLLEAGGLPHQVLNARYHAEEARIVAEAGQRGRITVATNMAGRGTDIKLGRGVGELGGLHVLATERHEARRIDRQLFGRCARQGDPGSAETMASLEDELVCRYAPRTSMMLRRRYGGAGEEVVSALAGRLFDGAQRRAERLARRQRQAVLAADDWLDRELGFSGAGE